MIVRDGKLVGATLLGDLSKVSFLMQAFDRGTVLPEERVSLLFDLGGAAGGGQHRRAARRRADLQLQRGQQGRHPRVRGGRRADAARR